MKKKISLIVVAGIVVLGMIGNSETTLASTTEYNKSYGEQLSQEDNSRLVYESMVKAYVYQDGDNGNKDGIYTGLAQNVNIVTKQLAINITNQSYSMSLTGKTSAQIETERNAWFQSAADDVVADVMAAFDAFVKDYPEVYWLYSVEATISYDVVVMGNNMTISIGNVYIMPKEYVNGSIGDISKYNDAVISAKKKVVAEYDITDTTCRSDTIKAIHDYLAERLDYSYDAVTHGITGSYAYAYTSMPAFLDMTDCPDTVCEGYAEAFSIMCNQFQIDNAIVTGNAINNNGKAERHMWNVVKMEDGKWYAIDVTWDDQESGIRYDYFLSGKLSKGFYYIFKEDHIAETVFSGCNYSKEFVIPQISEYGYSEAEKDSTENKITESATKVNNGSAIQNSTTVHEVHNVEASTTVVVNKAGNIVAEENVGRAKKENSGADYVDVNTTIGKNATSKDLDASGEKSEKVKRGTNKNATKTASEIKRVSIQKAKFGKIKVQKLKVGRACKPKVKVTYNGKKLLKNTDYTVAYKNNKKKGTAQIIIIGKGAFKGKKVIKFKIK